MKLIISKKVALETLYKNKQKHIDTYEETIKGWQRKMEEFSSELNKWAQEGGDPQDRPREHQKPQNYTEEYDALIKKLEHHVLDTIEIEEYEFDQIINDRFDWSSGFLSTASFYAGSN